MAVKGWRAPLSLLYIYREIGEGEMESICPLCNQLEPADLEVECTQCKSEMNDGGRMMDYFDDYSAYLDIDGMKLFNGLPDDQKNHQCPHLFYCPRCGEDHIILVEEIQW